MSTMTLDRLVARVDRLPRLPDTALRLVCVIGDPTSTIDQIVDAIRYDQAITAELLRLCNSVHFGLSRRIRSVDEAVVLLGAARVLQLVMSAHVRTTLRQPQEGYGLPPGALWEHSVVVALGCRAFAGRLALADRGLAFTLGLLHDVGKTVLNEHVVTEYAEIVRRVTDDGLSFSEAEQQVLGFTHAEVGARLAELWNLPDALIRSIRYHHEPQEQSPPDVLVDCTHLADATGLLTGIGLGATDGLSYRAQPDVLARHGLTRRDLESVGADVVVEMKAVRALFSDHP